MEHEAKENTKGDTWESLPGCCLSPLEYQKLRAGTLAKRAVSSLKTMIFGSQVSSYWEGNIITGEYSMTKIKLK